MAEAPKRPADVSKADVSRVARPGAPTGDTARAADSVPVAVGPFSVLPMKFGRYRIEKLLGKGAMGAVYLAHDTDLDRRVALKVARVSMAGSAKAIQRMETEAKAAAKIDHPLICKVYDFGEIDGIRFIAMQYVEGEDLKSYLKRMGRRQEPAAAIKPVLQIAQALKAAHDKDVIHRDLKPENIMINRKGDPVIMDFGLARRLTGANDAGLTQGMIVGTAAYMSPEQATGKAEGIDHRSDLYALGVILFEMLTGEWPFTGSAMEVMGRKSVCEAPSPLSINPDIPPQLAQVCHKLIAKKKEDRYSDCAELIAALEAVDLDAPVALDREVDMFAGSSSFAIETDGSSEFPDGLLAELPARRSKSTGKRNKPNEPLPSAGTQFAGGSAGRKRLLAVVAGGAGALVLLGVIVITITNRNGTKTKIEVPDTSKVEITSTSTPIPVPQPVPAPDPVSVPGPAPGPPPGPPPGPGFRPRPGVVAPNSAPDVVDSTPIPALRQPPPHPPRTPRQVKPRELRPKSPADLTQIRNADIDRGKSVLASADPAEFAEIVGEVAPGFTAISPVIPGGVAIVTEHFGRTCVLSTHPFDPTRPCILTSTVDVPADKETWLTFDVSHSAVGDWQVIVLANGEPLYDGAVGPTTAKKGWLTVAVDLTRFAGKRVVLELHNKATGYSHEWGFWDDVKITARELSDPLKVEAVIPSPPVAGPPTAGPPGFPGERMPGGKKRDAKVLVPTSQENGLTWRYTFTKPANNWFKPEFSTSRWRDGIGGFGGGQTPLVRTNWSTSDIWIRREFSLPEGNLGNPQLLLLYDEDAQVYLNGVLAAELAGFVISYELRPISAASRATLKAGKNVIAIHCRQIKGWQYIDAGLVDVDPAED